MDKNHIIDSTSFETHALEKTGESLKVIRDRTQEGASKNWQVFSLCGPGDHSAYWE